MRLGINDAGMVQIAGQLSDLTVRPSARLAGNAYAHKAIHFPSKSHPACALRHPHQAGPPKHEADKTFRMAPEWHVIELWIRGVPRNSTASWRKWIATVQALRLNGNINLEE